MWRGAVEGARLAQLGHGHSCLRKKKGLEIPSRNTEGEKS